VTCEFKDKYGYRYDLSALANVNKSEMIKYAGYDYFVTPCSPTPKNNATNCTLSNSPAIALWNGSVDNYCKFVLGDLKTQTFTYDYNTNRLVLAYTDGSVCGHYYGFEYDTYLKTEFKIFFECDWEIESDLYEMRSDEVVQHEEMSYEGWPCVNYFYWRTKYACRNRHFLEV